MKNESSIINKINKMCFQYGNQKEVAKFLKISSAYLNDIIHKRRKISDRIAFALGFKWELIKINKVKHGRSSRKI